MKKYCYDGQTPVWAKNEAQARVIWAGVAAEREKKAEAKKPDVVRERKAAVVARFGLDEGMRARMEGEKGLSILEWFESKGEDEDREKAKAKAKP